jgi:hypothetical protein
LELLAEHVLVAEIVRELAVRIEVLSFRLEIRKPSHVRAMVFFPRSAAMVARCGCTPAVPDGEDLLVVPVRAVEHVAELHEPVDRSASIAARSSFRYFSARSSTLLFSAVMLLQPAAAIQKLMCVPARGEA